MAKLAKRILAVILMAAILCLALCGASLQLGSQGSQVTTLQQKLKQWGYYTGKVDGYFGAETKAAVQYFQRTNGLTPDGVVGPATAAKLGMTLSGTASGGSSPSASSNDKNLLAHLIYGEARGESYVGQVAVAAVVLNRVRSSKFPNTVAGVIYQPLAFTCVADGQINLTPNATAYQAAADALNGWDPTGGALYYYNPAVATSQWIYSRPVIATIGKHVFAV